MINPSSNIYICGDSYSLRQAWIEGALETANKVFKLINLSSLFHLSLLPQLPLLLLSLSSLFFHLLSLLLTLPLLSSLSLSLLSLSLSLFLNFFSLLLSFHSLSLSLSLPPLSHNFFFLFFRYFLLPTLALVASLMSFAILSLSLNDSIVCSKEVAHIVLNLHYYIVDDLFLIIQVFYLIF